MPVSWDQICVKTPMWVRLIILRCVRLCFLRSNKTGSLLWFEELPVGHISIVALELAHLLDVLELAFDEGAVRVALAMHQCKDPVAVVPAILACEPTRRLRKAEIVSLEAVNGHKLVATHTRSPKNSPMAGSICRPHGTRNAAVPLMNEQP